MDKGGKLKVNVKNQYINDRMALYHGDSCEVLTEIPDNSIHFEIYSPPFASLYTYSNSDRDLGNCKTQTEFFEQFEFIAKELYRVLMPGRLMSVHCMNLPTSKERDGYIGIVDFRGDLIRLFQENGFIYHSEVCIWKDPVIAMQRTKALGLLHKQLKKDSCMSRQGIPDYLVTMRKPGVNPEPCTHTNDTFPVSIWQRYASPIWTDINPSDTLQKESARDDKDEKHICLAEGTLVLTKRGYIKIEDLIVGQDETLTHTGEWHKIVAKAMTKENADVIKVEATGVPNLIVTPNHKLYIKHSYGFHPKENIGKVDAVWEESKNIGKSDYLCLPLPPEIQSDISETEWWIIGRWLADGHMDSREHQFFISVGKDKIDDFKNKAKYYIGHITDKTKQYGCYQIGLKNMSHRAREILKKCGKHAYDKKLPVEAISLNKILSKAIYEGYKSGDGHTTKNGHEVFTSVSRQLLLGMQIVVMRAYGKSASVYRGRDSRKYVILGRTVECKKEWIMTVSPHYSFNSIIDNFEWKRVKGTKQVENKNVWSIEVEIDHSFTAEGCIVKNCPLQLEVIERAVKLWTNSNDIVLSPFGGIGSEPYVALKNGRRAVAIELKDSYYKQMELNCKTVIESEQVSLF